MLLQCLIAATPFIGFLGRGYKCAVDIRLGCVITCYCLSVAMNHRHRASGVAALLLFSPLLAPLALNL